MNEAQVQFSPKDEVRYGMASRLRRTAGLAVAGGLAAIAISCSSGEVKAQTPPDNSYPDVAPVAVVSNPPVAESAIVGLPPVVEVKPLDAETLPVRSVEPLPPGKALIAFANQVVKPKYVPNLTDINNGRIINDAAPGKKKTDSQYANYARSVKVGGNELVFSSEVKDGLSTSEYVVKDRYKQSDSSQKAIIDMMTTFLNVPEGMTLKTLDYGKGVTGYEAVLNRTPDFQVSLFAYTSPDVEGSTPETPMSIIRIGACAVPADAPQYAKASCLSPIAK